MTPIMEKIDKHTQRFNYRAAERIGFFLFLGWGSLTGRSGDTQETMSARMQMFPPCNINTEYRDLLEKIDFLRIHRVYDELVWRYGFDITPRILNNVQEFNFINHQIIDETEERAEKLWQAERIFSRAMKLFGEEMIKVGYGPNEAYKCGICLANIRFQYDVEASQKSMTALRRHLPLIWGSADLISHQPDSFSDGYLDIQIPLQIFLSGTEPHFGQMVWYYQSWILFKDQKPIHEVTSMSDAMFMDWCRRRADDFYQAFHPKILETAESSQLPFTFPVLDGDFDEKHTVLTSIEEHFGKPEKSSNRSKVLSRALIIYAYFCCLCETALHHAGKRPIH